MPIWSPSSGQTEFSTTAVSTLTAPATVINTVAGTVPLTLTGASGQSVDLLDIGAFGGAAGGLVKVNSSGSLIAGNGVYASAMSTAQLQAFGGPGNGLQVAGFVGVASSVNYVQVTNAATGTAPIIAATGSDAAVGLAIQTRNASAPVNALTFSAAGVGTFPVGINAGAVQVSNIQDTGGASNVIKVAANAVAFYGVTPVARAAAITAVVTTASALASYGFTQAQADSIPTRINAIITALQNIGITL
jgi:hypothetical protein